MTFDHPSSNTIHGVPRSHWHCHLHNYDAPKERLVESVSWFLEEWENQKIPAPHLLLTGKQGRGKCLGKNTPVLKYNGDIVPVQCIVEGDLLMGPDSTPRRVINTTAGYGSLYKVTPVKGGAYVVNEHHILTLARSGTNNLVDISVKEYFLQNKTFQKRSMGVRSSVDWPEQPVEVDPYFLGVWLGDGSKEGPVITTPDQEIIEYLHSFAKSKGLVVSRRQYGKACASYRINMPSQPKTTREKGLFVNPITSFLNKYELLNTSNRTIPKHYLINSREKRLALLAGLLDTDGHLKPDGCVFEIITKYKDLSEDIMFLCRSLGLAAYCSEKEAYATNTKEKTVRTYYRICISGNTNIIPTKVERKKAQPRKQIKDVLKTGISIAYNGTGEYYGFELDGDGRFLLGDFTITHNSHIGVGIYRAAVYTTNIQDCAYIHVPDFCVRTKRSYGDGEDPFLEVEDASLVVLDDIFGADMTEHEISKILARLITTAYDKNQALVVTSNYSKNEISGILQPHETSRLLQNCKIMNMTSDRDHRLG